MAAHIGIVGCSAEGAALCFRTICAEGPAMFGAHAHPEVSLHVPPFAEYVRCLDRGDVAGVGELLLRSANTLIGAGADVLICPDNTIHAALEPIAARVTRPWLHIADVVADAAMARGFRKVGLLGTRWLVASDVYPSRLAARGIEAVRPTAEDGELVHRAIMDELVPARASAGLVPALRGVIARLAAAGCDAVILGCTELPLVLDDTVSPLPTLDSTRLLARAALRWARDDWRHPNALALLGRLQAQVSETDLRVYPESAATTRAYISLIFAYGYARLGHVARAAEGVAEASRVLTARDETHAWLLAAYEARIAQAIAGAPREAPLPEALIASHAVMDRKARYRVDRLREASQILEPFFTVDSIGASARQLLDGRGEDISALAGMSIPARAVEIARLVEYAGTGTSEDERILGAAFDYMLTLPSERAIPLVARTTALVAEAPIASRATLCARALAVAAYFGQPDAAVVEQLCEALPHAEVGALGWASTRTLRTLHTQDRRDEGGRVVAAASAAPSFASDVVARAACAGASAWLSRSGEASTAMRELRREPDRPLSSAIARAAGWFDLGHRGLELERLSSALRDIRDGLSTSSHFSVSILDFVEGLALGASGD